MENTKKSYEAPQLTVVTFEAEQGFTASGGLSQLFFWNNAWSTPQVEDYQQCSGWTDDGSNSFF